MKTKTIKNWFLKLKYGKIKTQFQHYVLLLDGFAESEITDYNSNVCPKGNAWMSIKVWANDTDEAVEIASAIASNIGFQVKKIQIYEQKPDLPPEEKPFAYDSHFFPYKE